MATGDAGFSHTDELLANVAELHKLPIRLHIYASASSRINTEQSLQGVALPSVITGKNAMGRQRDSRALHTSVIWCPGEVNSAAHHS